MKFAKLVRIESEEAVTSVPLSFPDNVPEHLIQEVIRATQSFELAQDRIWLWVMENSVQEDDKIPCPDGLDESGHIISKGD